MSKAFADLTLKEFGPYFRTHVLGYQNGKNLLCRFTNWYAHTYFSIKPAPGILYVAVSMCC